MVDLSRMCAAAVAETVAEQSLVMPQSEASEADLQEVGPQPSS